MTEKFERDIADEIKVTIMSYVAKSVNHGQRRGKCFRLRLPVWFENRYFYACIHDLKWKPNKWKCSYFHHVECSAETYQILMTARDREFETKNMFSK